MSREDIDNSIKHISFENKVGFCLHASLDILHKKYFKEDPLSGNEAFVIDSLFDYIVRLGDNIVVPMSEKTICDLLNKGLKKMFSSQNQYVEKIKTDHFTILFSLWEFEEQEDPFIKMYRFNQLFSFKNESFDAQKVFVSKFQTSYDRFLEFALLIYLLSTGKDFIGPSLYLNYCGLVFNQYKDVTKFLTISLEKYKFLSEKYCPDINMIAQSLKPSYSYPLIRKGDVIHMPLPHTVIVACTKSLLYRITDGDNDLRSKFGKEAFESYTLHIMKESGVYDMVLPEIVYFANKNELKTPDVLCFKNNRLVAIECKLLTPSTKIRLLDDQAMKELKDILVDDLCKLYKSLFVNYQNNYEGVPKIDKENRIGYLISFERLDFNHKIILDLVAQRLSFNENETKFLYEHVFFGCIFDLERFTFANGDLFKEFDYMIANNKTFDFNISCSSTEKEYTFKKFLDFKDRILSLESANEIFSEVNKSSGK